MEKELAQFVFDTVDKPLGIISTNNSLEFANPSFSELIGFPEFTPNLLLEDFFESSSPINERVVVKNARNLELQASFHPYKKEKVLVNFQNNPIEHSLTKSKKSRGDVDKKFRHLKQVELLETMKAFFDYSPDPMMVAETIHDDTDFILRFVNNSYCQKVEKDSSEILNRPAISVLGIERVTNWLPWMIKSKHERSHFQFEFSQNGHYYRAVVTPVGENTFACAASDITEKTLYEINLEETVRTRTSELEQALIVKSRFLATMSHELRTPLAGITACLSLLTDSILPPDSKDIMRTAMICGDQLAGVIDDILEVSKLEENKVQLEELSFSLSKLIEDSLEIVCFECEKKHLELIADIHPDIQDIVIGDARRLQQILVNLLSNAVKFTAKGEVLISAKSTNLPNDLCRVEISVKDEGIGISEAALKILFQPFTQGDNTVTRKYGGTGLGLNISKRLAELMGGTLSTVSKEGEGSTFTVAVTLKKEKGIFSPLTLKSKSTSKKNVLVLDKSQTRLNIIGNLLQRWDVQYSLFSSDVEMKEFLGENPDLKFDLSIVDSSFGPDILKHAYLLCYSRPRDLPLEIQTIRKPLRIEPLFNRIFNDGQSISTPKLERHSAQLITLRILIAEDNEVNQKLFKMVLVTLGVLDTNITLVNNGKQALDAVLKQKFDLVLMDMMMPIMGGIESAQLIRKLLPVEKQPVIFALTANILEEDRRKCLEAGMSEVITKPVSRTILRDKLLSLFC